MTLKTNFRWEANAFLGFFERQKNLYKRYWVWEVVWFLYSMVTVLSIGYLASGLEGSNTNTHELARVQLYLLVGSLIWSYLSLVFFEVSFAISWERWEGTIEYTFMAPVRRVTHLMGVCSFAILYGILRTALILVAVALAFHLDLTNANLWAACLVLFASTFPIIGLGIFTAMLPLLSPEKGEQMSVAIQGILLLVSGVYYPLTVLPAVLQALGRISPLTYTLSGIRDALLDGHSVGSLLPVVAFLLLAGAILIAGGLRAFAWAENRAKRLGTLKRSG